MPIFDKKLYVSLTRQKTSHICTKIALKPLNTNLFNIVLSSIFLTMGTCNLYSQDIKNKTKAIPAQKEKSSPILTPLNKDTSVPVAKTETDSLKNDSIPPNQK